VIGSDERSRICFGKPFLFSPEPSVSLFLPPRLSTLVPSLFLDVWCGPSPNHLYFSWRLLFLSFSPESILYTGHAISGSVRFRRVLNLIFSISFPLCLFSPGSVPIFPFSRNFLLDRLFRTDLDLVSHLLLSVPPGVMESDVLLKVMTFTSLETE